MDAATRFTDKTFRRYFDRFYNHGCRIPKDRSNWSKNEARASLLNRVFLNKINFNREEPFSPKKTFKSTTFSVGGSSIYINQNQESIPIKDIKSGRGFSSDFINKCYINIGDGSNSDFLFKYPKKVGARPTTVKVSRPAYASFFNSKFCPSKYRGRFMTHAVLNGGWSSAQKQLRIMSEGTRLTPDYSCRRSLEMAGHVLNRISPEFFLRTPKSFDINFYKIKPLANPGGDFDTVFINKQKAYNTALKCAKDLFRTIHKDFIPNNTIYTVGGRAKRVKPKLYADVYARAVLQHDIVEFLVAKPYTSQLEDHFKNDFAGPICFGFEKTRFNMERVSFKRKLYKNSFEADWSQWDARTIAEKIIVAFGICRSFFPASEDIDRAFCYFTDGFLNKTVVCPDGNTFKFYKGVPSGSAWTSIINSIVNCLLTEEIFRKYRAFGLSDFDYQVLGDDTEVFFDKDVKLNMETFTKWVKGRTGGDIEVKKISKPIRNVCNDSTTFLKISSYYDGDTVRQSTSADVLFERCSAIQSKANNELEVGNFLYSQLETYITDWEAQRFIANFCTYYALMTGMIGIKEVFKHRNSLLEHIDRVNELVYDCVKPTLSVLKYTKNDAARVFAFSKSEDYFEPSDDVLYENWCKDNIITHAKRRIPKESRRQWFIRQMGERFGLHALFNNYLPKLFNICGSKKALRSFLGRVGVSIGQLLDMYKNYKAWGFDASGNAPFGLNSSQIFSKKDTKTKAGNGRVQPTS